MIFHTSVHLMISVSINSLNDIINNLLYKVHHIKIKEDYNEFIMEF